jgi:hypothetical protein
VKLFGQWSLHVVSIQRELNVISLIEKLTTVTHVGTPNTGKSTQRGNSGEGVIYTNRSQWPDEDIAARAGR